MSETVAVAAPNTPARADTRPAPPPSLMARLADIPEEEIWLAKQKSARTRRAYRLDVRQFLATLGIATAAELRQVDHRAVIAWERAMRETQRAARPRPSAGGCRRCPACSSTWSATAMRPGIRCARSSGR